MSEQINEEVKKRKKQNRVKSPDGTIETKMVATKLANGLETETKVFAVTYPGYKDLTEEGSAEVLTKPEADEWIVGQRRRWRRARSFDLARQGVGATLESLLDRATKIDIELLAEGEQQNLAEIRGSLKRLARSIREPEIVKVAFLATKKGSGEDEQSDADPGD
jgi:hypothetical protein